MNDQKCLGRTEGGTDSTSWLVCTAHPFLISVYSSCLSSTPSCCYVSQHLCVHFIDKFPFPLFLHLLKTQFHLWIIFWFFSFARTEASTISSEHVWFIIRRTWEQDRKTWFWITNYKAAIKYAHFNQPYNYHITPPPKKINVHGLTHEINK